MGSEARDWKDLEQSICELFDLPTAKDGKDDSRRKMFEARYTVTKAAATCAWGIKPKEKTIFKIMDDALELTRDSDPKEDSQNSINEQHLHQFVQYLQKMLPRVLSGYNSLAIQLSKNDLDLQYRICNTEHDTVASQNSKTCDSARDKQNFQNDLNPTEGAKCPKKGTDEARITKLIEITKKNSVRYNTNYLKKVVQEWRQNRRQDDGCVLSRIIYDFRQWRSKGVQSVEDDDINTKQMLKYGECNTIWHAVFHYNSDEGKKSWKMVKLIYDAARLSNPNWEMPWAVGLDRGICGETPLHLLLLCNPKDEVKAFFKELWAMCPAIHNVVYTHRKYRGENILHIAIIKRAGMDVIKTIVECGSCQDTGNVREDAGNPFKRTVGSTRTLLVQSAVGDFFTTQSDGVCNVWGEFPHYFAACTNQLDVLKYLVEQKADLNARTSDRNNLLHLLVLSSAGLRKDEESEKLEQVYIKMYDSVVELMLHVPDDKDKKQEDKEQKTEEQNIKLEEKEQNSGSGQEVVCAEVYKTARRQRNAQGFTPLTLAAARGSVKMFIHVFEKEMELAWVYGPVKCRKLYLKGIDMPIGKEEEAEIDPNHSLLEVLVDHRRKDILSHPLVDKLVLAKWSRYGQRIFRSRLLMTVAFTVCLVLTPMTDPQCWKITHTAAHITACLILAFDLYGEVRYFFRARGGANDALRVMVDVMKDAIWTEVAKKAESPVNANMSLAAAVTGDKQPRTATSISDSKSGTKTETDKSKSGVTIETDKSKGETTTETDKSKSETTTVTDKSKGGTTVTEAVEEDAKLKRQPSKRSAAGSGGKQRDDLHKEVKDLLKSRAFRLDFNRVYPLIMFPSLVILVSIFVAKAWLFPISPTAATEVAVSSISRRFVLFAWRIGGDDGDALHAGSLAGAMADAGTAWGKHMAHSKAVLMMEKLVYAIASSMSFVRLLVLLTGFEVFGTFILILYRVMCQDLPKFVVIYLVFLLGFAHLHYLASNPLHSGVQDGLKSFIHILSAMLHYLQEDSEVDNVGRAAPLADSGEGVEREDRWPATVWVLTMINFFLVTVVLLNLLVAMLTSTFEDIAEEARENWKLLRADILLSIDRRMTSAERLHRKNTYWETDNTPAPGQPAIEMKEIQGRWEKYQQNKDRPHGEHGNGKGDEAGGLWQSLIDLLKRVRSFFAFTRSASKTSSSTNAPPAVKQSGDAIGAFHWINKSLSVDDSEHRRNASGARFMSFTSNEDRCNYLCNEDEKDKLSMAHLSENLQHIMKLVRRRPSVF